MRFFVALPSWLRILLVAVVPLRSFAAVNLPSTEPIWGYGLTNVLPGLTFNQPVGIVSAPGETNRLFIVEQTGRIMVIPDLTHPTSQVFLDLSKSTWASDEGGLLGLAFHPRFAENGRFFVYRTIAAGTFRDVLSEFHCDPPTANVANSSERTMISQIDEMDTHNAGDLKFGSDGYLYLAIGDEQPGSKDSHDSAQAIDKGLFGGIIRIDIDEKPENLAPNPHPSVYGGYRIPRDNPFIGATSFNGEAVDPLKVRTEWYAVGFRNPWRFTFDPLTQALIAADVGGGFWEEIDLVEKGGNYGWPYLEADLLAAEPPLAMKPPIYSYAHGTGLYEGLAVIGGVVYRGNELPGLYGKYLFGDFGTGHIWALDWNIPGSPADWLTSRAGLTTFGLHPADGGVLVANRLTGKIERLTYRAPDANKLPLSLSETAAFQDLATLTPAESVLPFEVITPLWSDGAVKSRWVDFSGSQGKITFKPTDPWTMPPGAVWIKHFELELTNGVAASRKRVETRFLVKTDDDIYGLTYRWNDSGNAFLVPPEGASQQYVIRDNGTIRTQVWNFPSWQQCRTCHNPQAGFILGFQTVQLNRTVTREGVSTNQLDWFAGRGIFSKPKDVHPDRLPNLVPLSDRNAPSQYKVRSYLQSNCAHCHRPGGALGPIWDARIGTPLKDAHIFDAPSIFYPAPMKIIAPRSEENSFILFRTQNRLNAAQMPPLATTLVDSTFLDELKKWIGTVPEPSWISTNIGSALAEGAGEQTGRRIRVSSAGRGADLDSIFFLSREVSGAAELSAKLASFGSNAPHGEAGLMFRTSFQPQSSCAAVIFKDGQLSLRTRTSPETELRQYGSVAAGPGTWVRLVSRVNSVQAWTSQDGRNWQQLGSAPWVAPSRYYSGFFAASTGQAVQFASGQFEECSLNSITVSATMSGSILLPRTVTLTAGVSLDPSTNAAVIFRANGQELGRATNQPWSFVWTNSDLLTASITAELSTANGQIQSAPITLQFEAPAPQVWINPVDEMTLGNWSSRYGREYFIVPGAASGQRTNLTVTVDNGSTTVIGESSDPSALQVRTNGIAAQIHDTNHIEIHYAAGDYKVHRGALYFMDWLNAGAVQTVSFFLPGATEPAASTNVTATQGVYLPFAFRGEIIIRVQNATGESYVSGLFGDSVRPVTAAFEPPLEGLSIQQPLPLSITAVASAPRREVARVEFWDGATQLASLSEPPYTYIASNLLAGAHELRAVAYGPYELSGESTRATVNVLPVPTRVTFVGEDSTTAGSWRSRYGGDGYWLFGDRKDLPDFVEVLPRNGTLYVFSDPAGGPAALERIDGSSRLAASLHDSPELIFDVTVRDPKACTIGFYFLDWDVSDRTTRAFVEDSAGTLLDMRDVQEFSGGKYLLWSVQGAARFRFRGLSGNVVISGVFADEGLSFYDTWRSDHFSPEELAVLGAGFDLADSDGDGFGNALEYFLGTDPKSAANKPALSYSIAPSGVVLSVRTKGTHSGVVLEFETSTDLLVWTAAEAFTNSNLLQDGSQQVSYRITLDEGATGFVRFKPVRH